MNTRREETSKARALALCPMARAVKCCVGSWVILRDETQIGRGANPLTAWADALATLEQRK